MKTTGTLILVAAAALICGCAATVPNELTAARLAYEQASTGPAAQLAPAELHKARLALNLAEQSFANDPDSYQTRDLAYVAERTAQMAAAHAAIGLEKESQASADAEFLSTQGSILRETAQDLNETRAALAVSEAVSEAVADAVVEQSGQVAAQRLASEQEDDRKAEWMVRLETAPSVAAQDQAQDQAQDLDDTQRALAVSEHAEQVASDRLAVEQKARFVAEEDAAAQGVLVETTSRELSQVRTALAASEQAGLATSQQLVAEQDARRESEQMATAESMPGSLPSPTSAQDLSRMQSALAVSEYAGQVTSERLAVEQKARSDAEAQTRSEAQQKSAAQGLLMERATQDLSQARTALAVSEQAGLVTAQQLAAEQQGRFNAEQKTAAAEAMTTQAEAKTAAAETRTAAAETALAKLAATREDERGTIITLSGGVLFRSNEAILMPGAALQLDQVAAALGATSDRNVIVEGYTDSQGSAAYNLALSQQRADVVRDYLVYRGYPAASMLAHGIGEGSPIADNATSAGRADNRRVEIVLERMPTP